MELIFSLEEGVHIKGTEKQRKQFEVTGRLSTDALKSIIRAFKEDFETVCTEGRGKNKQIVLSDKRPKPVRMDGRKENRGNEYQTPTAKYVEKLLVALLLGNEGSYKGAISNIMFNANLAGKFISYYKSPDSIESLNKLMNKPNSNNEVMFTRHVVSKEFTAIETSIVSALVRMNRRGIINWSKKKIGVVKTFKPKLGTLTNKPIVNKHHEVEGSYQDFTKELTDHEEQEITRIERELRQKHNVDHFELQALKNSKKVKRYNNELEKSFHNLGFDFYFDCYYIYLKTPKEKAIKKYDIDDDFLYDTYYRKAINYAVKKADKYSADNKEKLMIKYNHGFGELDLGKLNPMEVEVKNDNYLHKFKNVYHYTLPNEYKYLLPLTDTQTEN